MAVSKNQIRRLSRLVKLSYLQTVSIIENQKTTDDYVGTPTPYSANVSNFKAPNFLFNLSAGLFGDGGGSTSVDFQDTGWTISRTWLETYWDKIRYAVGVREAGIHQFTYNTVSEFVSIPFTFPGEVDKVSLMVSEIIPNDFPKGINYIEYYVSQNPETEWYQINPLDSPTIFSQNGNVVPRIINFNAPSPAVTTSENKYVTTKTPVTSLRLRAVFRRPDNIENSESMTSILKSYRLMAHTRIT